MPQLHDPKLVLRALKRLERWHQPSHEESPYPSLIVVTLILDLIVSGLFALIGHTSALPVIQGAFGVLIAILSLFWLAWSLDRRLLSAPDDVWYVEPDGRVRSAKRNFLNTFERRRLFRFTKETRVALPSGESILLFKDDPTTETIQEVIDMLVRLESAKDYVDRHDVTGQYRRVRIEDDAAFRASIEPQPIELVSAEELKRQKEKP